MAKRNVDIGNQRNQVECRLHSLLMALSPGGIAKELNACDAIAVLERVELTIEISDDALAPLVDAARFDAMRARARRLVPDRLGVLKDPSAFFREGGSGAGRAVAGAADLALYESRARSLAPPALLAWLHR